MQDIWYNMHSTKKHKPQSIKVLPPCESSLVFHVFRAHLQVVLWKSADRQSPPTVEITNFGFEVSDDIIPFLHIELGSLGPLELLDK